MATKNGMYTRGGVRSTMSSPCAGKGISGGEGVGGGRYGSIGAPFDKPQSTGNGGIPVKMMDGMTAKKATTSNAGASATVGVSSRAVGNRRFTNPK